MDGGYRGNYRGGWRGGGGGRQNYYDDGYQGGRGPPRGGRGGGGGYRGGFQGGYQGGWDDGYQGGGYQGGAPPPPPRGGPPGPSYHGDGYQGGRGGGAGGGDRGRGRNNYNWGRGGGRYNRPRRPRQQQEQPAEDVVAVTELKQHTKQITCLYYDSGTQQLYSGASDGQIVAWNQAGQMVSSDQVLMGIDSILVEAGFMFVGMSKDQTGEIKVYNLNAGGASHVLSGHKGQVLALAVGNGTLFSGGQDASLRVWAFDQATSTFSQQVVLTYATHDGHKGCVHSIVVSSPYMFSADREGTIKVWDLASGNCCQTLERAHKVAITKLLLYGDSTLVSAGLDGSIKCWASGAPVLSPEPAYEFFGEQQDDSQPPPPPHQRQAQQQQQQPLMPGVVTMELGTDSAQTAVLMVACANERQIRLIEVPSFTSRGVILNVNECRALACVPPLSMVAGERNGTIKVFQWKS